MNWPNNKDFAFSIVDDTDMSTLENVKPIYDLLIDCGLKTTKTVWVYPHEGTYFSPSHTLQHAAYLEFVKDLQRRGFEIASHGARGCSSDRPMIIKALEEFKVHFGSYPTMHINHAQNEDNLYWGFNKLYGFQKLLDKWGIKKYSRRGIGHGADPNSKYFWGDIAKEKIKYVRGKSYNSINQLKWDRFAPYHDDRLPLVNYWFSSCNGNEYTDFNKLLSEENQEQLVAEKGLCIVYTHFGSKGFVDEKNRINSETEKLIKSISKKNGWFAPASEILDYLNKDHQLTNLNRIELFRNRNK